MQKSRATIYLEFRTNSRSFLFARQSETKYSERELSIYIDIMKKLRFRIEISSERLLKIIKMYREKNRKLINDYNEQCDLLNAQ
jgi:nanoRNase/pAp phosphatase (c-di-AMP/oligoRNAs hydrolase)